MLSETYPTAATDHISSLSAWRLLHVHVCAPGGLRAGRLSPPQPQPPRLHRPPSDHYCMIVEDAGTVTASTKQCSRTQDIHFRAQLVEFSLLQFHFIRDQRTCEPRGPIVCPMQHTLHGCRRDSWSRRLRPCRLQCVGTPPATFVPPERHRSAPAPWERCLSGRSHGHAADSS